MGKQLSEEISSLEAVVKSLPHNTDEVEARITSARSMLEENTLSQALKYNLRQQLEKVQKDIFNIKKKAMMSKVEDGIKKAKEEALVLTKSGSKKIVLRIDIGSDAQAIKLATDEIKKVAPGVAFIGISADNEKISCFAYVPDEMFNSIKANEWVSKTLESCGGKGGGRPGMAQGSAPTGDDTRMNRALKAALDQASSCIS
jgi:alanyl-tRNA synthetase